MKPKARKSVDLTLRLSPEERRVIDSAAAAEHLSSSTWLRRLALTAAEEADAAAARRRVMSALAAKVRAGRLKPVPGHAAEVERRRSRDWKR